MAFPITTYINGISALVVLILGFILGFGVLFLYFRSGRQKRLMPYVSILGFSGGAFYLGPVVSFFNLLATGENIPAIVYGLLSYSHIPIVICASMYLGFELFKPEWRDRVLLVFVLSSIVYWIALLGFPSVMISGTIGQEGDLIDISLHSVVIVLVVVYIFSTLIMLGGGFYHLSKRLTDKEGKRRARELYIGFILFSIGGILDTVISLEYIVIARSIMGVAYFLINSGFIRVR